MTFRKVAYSSLIVAGFCMSLVAQSHQCSLAQQESGQEMYITAQGGDPMLQIIELVRVRYGWLVSYEAAISSGGNLEDVSDAHWRTTHPGSRGVLVPKSHSVTVHFRLPSSGTRDAKATLSAIVSQVNSSQSLVHYGLASGKDDRYSVYGEDRYRGVGGVAGASIEIDDRPGADSSSEGGKIIEACSKGSPLPFELGTMNPNALNHVATLPKHHPESCRNALDRLTQSISPSAVYEVLEDTVNMAMALNIIRADYRDNSGDCPAGVKPGAVQAPTH